MPSLVLLVDTSLPVVSHASPVLVDVVTSHVVVLDVVVLDVVVSQEVVSELGSPLSDPDSLPVEPPGGTHPTASMHAAYASHRKPTWLLYVCSEHMVGSAWSQRFAQSRQHSRAVLLHGPLHGAASDAVGQHFPAGSAVPPVGFAWVPH